MILEKTERSDNPPEPSEPPESTGEVRSLDVWYRSAPIRLAGYEDDLIDPHILRGID